MTNDLWTFIIHTGGMFIGFATFVALSFLVVNLLVRE